MASLSTNLKLMDLLYGESGSYGYTNWGDLQDANLAIIESALTEKSDITVTTADVTLTDAQHVSLHLNASGALTGNRSIVLKSGQKGFWVVTNGTTGSYTLTVKPSGGSGVVIDQGKRALIISDGTTASFITKIGDLLNVETVSSDADFTLTWGTNSEAVLHTGTLTADRAVTLSTTGAVKGARWRITRTGSGSFNLNIGTGPLKALRQNMWAEFVYDGTAWYLAEHGITNMSAFSQTLLDDADAAAMRTTLGVNLVDIQTFTASGTWTKASGSLIVFVAILGAGGGGGSGRRGAAGSARQGGGGGGGGAYNFAWFLAADLTSTVAVTIGAGGTAGAAVGSDSTNGNAGGNGGNTTFGAYLTAYGGGGGQGGDSGTVGGQGGGVLGAGTSSITTGTPFPFVSDDGSNISHGQFGGTLKTNRSSGFGGGTGGSGSAGNENHGSGSAFGGPGGGQGGGITAGNAAQAGKDGGSSSTGIGGGTSGGAAGNAGTSTSSTVRAGGGGGGGNGGTGGNGAMGSGAGGGGASLNGSASGAGGIGGNGWCRVISF